MKLNMEAAEKRDSRSILDIYDFYLSKIENFMLLVSSLLIMFALLVVGIGVITRYFFNINFTWAIELNEYIMLYIAFLVASWVLKNDGHVEVDIFVSRISNENRRKFKLLTSVLAIVITMILFWYSFIAVIDSFQRGIIISNVLDTPKYIPLLSIPIGSLMLFLRNIHIIGNLIIRK